MKYSYLLPLLASSTASLADAIQNEAVGKLAAFFLAGDSTTAIQIPVNGGGTCKKSLVYFKDSG
jgi:hypothetical protein